MRGFQKERGGNSQNAPSFLLSFVSSLSQKENNIDFINFNSMYDELGIDFKSDFIDEGKHLNFMGAHKVSDYLSDYISNSSFYQ